MQDALQIAATGMQAQQLHVDTIANNLANVATTGFKRARVSFHDLVTRVADASIASSAPTESSGSLSAMSHAGVGVSVASVSRHFDGGELRQTESMYDLAIAGEGFVEVAMPDGTRAFTRGGVLRVNGDGLLATGSGQPLAGAIAVPDNMETLLIDAEGRVQAKVHGQSRPVDLGMLSLVRFMAPGALAVGGDGLYRPTEQSGEAIGGRAGEDGLGVFRQAHLEGSNVKMVDEMVGLMVAQRAYEASVNVARAADEMLGMVNNLRK
jgi:flagellar basal-body rod protein FlgG